MQKVNKILFIADGSPSEAAALRRAVQLAGEFGAVLTVMDTVDRYSSVSSELVIQQAVTALQASAVRERRTALERLVKPVVRGTGVKYDVEVATGTDYVETIRIVQKRRIGLVMKAASGGLALLRLFGDADMHLLRMCPCPVWIARPTRQKRHARILAAVDTSAGDKASIDLNRKIIDFSASIAAMEDAELHVVHAWRLLGEPSMRADLYPMPEDVLDKLRAETRARHEKQVEALLRRYRDRKITVHIREGAPADVIQSMVKSKKIDLLVMGTVSRSGVAGLLLGNTAESIMHKVKCALLTLKPSTFKTPIKT